MFLVGRGIPEHITSLPQTVLNTPFGQMLRPQIDSAMREITQAPVPPPSHAALQSPRGPAQMTNGAAGTEGKVHNVTSLQEVETLLSTASSSCAVVFFTSSTCAPCKLVYPDYDQLAAEAGQKAVLIKVDINYAQDVAAKYGIHATPTFMTFLRGQKEEEWSGADPNRLRGSVRMLIQSAFPPHPHANLELPHLLRTSLRPVTYKGVPPLDKLTAKLGEVGKKPIISSIKNFISTRQSSGAIEAPLPDLTSFSNFLLEATTLPPDTLFPLVDLLRCTLVDPRVSGFFCEQVHAGAIHKLLSRINSIPSCPYNLRLVTLQLCCNLFTSPIFRTHVLPQHLSDQPFNATLTTLLSTSLLDDAHPQTRVAASSLAFNLAVAVHTARTSPSSPSAPEPLTQDDQVELLASLLEALSSETESKDAVKGLVLAIGFLVYYAAVDGEVLDLCRAMDAEGTVKAKQGVAKGEDVMLVREVGGVLLERGLR